MVTDMEDMHVATVTDKPLLCQPCFVTEAGLSLGSLTIVSQETMTSWFK